jgi:hypothetical protein
VSQQGCAKSQLQGSLIPHAHNVSVASIQIRLEETLLNGDGETGGKDYPCRRVSISQRPD